MDLRGDRCWFYEGLVLPGNKIMLGRWRAPAEAPYRGWRPRGDDPKIYKNLVVGPWIFWATD